MDSSYSEATENGTLKEPCKSISKCVYDFAKSGDSVYLLPGVYNGSDNVGICSEFIARTKNYSATRLTISGTSHDPAQVVWSWDADSMFIQFKSFSF